MASLAEERRVTTAAARSDEENADAQKFRELLNIPGEEPSSSSSFRSKGTEMLLVLLAFWHQLQVKCVRDTPHTRPPPPLVGDIHVGWWRSCWWTSSGHHDCAVGVKAVFVWRPWIFCCCCFIGILAARLQMGVPPLAPRTKPSRCGFLLDNPSALGSTAGRIDLLELYYCKHLKHMTRSDSHVPLSILELYHVAASIR